MSRIQFLNIEIDNLTMEEALDAIDALIAGGEPSYAVTPNVDHIVQLERNEELAEAYRHANLILTDGKPLLWISRLFGTPIKEKISGSDLFPHLCALAARKGYRMYFLGAGEGVAELAARRLREQNPGLQVVETYAPPVGFDEDAEELERIRERIRKVCPEILVVSLGCPKQEIFVYRNLREIGVPFSIGLGASMDFASGLVKRAPRWMSEMGLEWLHRLLQDPRRLARRYLHDDRRIFSIVYSYYRAFRRSKREPGDGA